MVLGPPLRLFWRRISFISTHTAKISLSIHDIFYKFFPLLRILSQPFPSLLNSIKDSIDVAFNLIKLSLVLTILLFRRWLEAIFAERRSLERLRLLLLRLEEVVWFFVYYTGILFGLGLRNGFLGKRDWGRSDWLLLFGCSLVRMRL